MSESGDLPLESYLNSNCSNGDLFPYRKTGYSKRYQAIKDYMATDVYKHINAGAASSDGGLYTDHSEDHFDSVIKYAGHLLDFPSNGEGNGNATPLISPYETFMLLVSILVHDAGMIFERAGHPKKVNVIMKEMGQVAFPDEFERIEIARIARAHAGEVTDFETEKKTKDTIGQPELKEENAFGDAKFRPKLLAALVRFSDEICEDRSRAIPFLLNSNKIPKESEVFHKYAYSISSVLIDHQSRLLKIDYQIMLGDVMCKFGKMGKNQKIHNVYLIDEISERLEKMYHELIYCRDFMYQVVDLRMIRATIEVTDDTGEFPSIIETQTIEIKQEGFPEGHFSISSKYPNWNGAKLKSRLNKYPL